MSKMKHFYNFAQCPKNSTEPVVEIFIRYHYYSLLAIFMAKPSRMIITGVPPYVQQEITNKNGKKRLSGCGPVAALMWMANYDRRYGYKHLVPKDDESSENPESLLAELGDLMETIYGNDYAMTIPLTFKSGLKKYIKKHYDNADWSKESTKGILTTLKDVFDKSVELIRDNKIHFLLFDWEGSGWIFPNHYVVVVGYRKDGDRMELVVNNGWGDDFQIIDMSDKKVKPGTIFWLEIEDKPDGQKDGHQIGPACNYNWQKDDNGKEQLKPDLKKHFSRTETTNWRHSDSAEWLIPNTEIRRCEWFD